MPCIGDTDSRYNQDISYDLKEQENFWNSLEGLFVEDIVVYKSDGTPDTNNAVVPAPLGTYDFSNVKSFLNVTVNGSRYYNHGYIMVKHNSDGPGGMQLPGLVNPTDLYAASTFEKDGGAMQMGIAQGFGNDLVLAGENPAILKPIGGKMLLTLAPNTMNPVIKDRSFEVYESLYCVDSECKESNAYNEQYHGYQDDIHTPSITFARTSRTKVDKDTWMTEIGKVYTDFSIPSPDDPFTLLPGFNGPSFSQPFDATTSDRTPPCVNLECPTDENWALIDPYLGTSPYIEPDGVLTGGFIAGVTISSIVVALLVFYMIYKRGVEAREKRVKKAVLNSLSKCMSLKISKNLTAKDLNEMFQKIDDDGNGNIDKDEMKKLVEEADVANMSDRDYDVLFASIDLDGNGTLDFVEFCAFFASINVEEEGNDETFEDA